MAEALNKLLKNYVRCFRTSLPSAKYYQIPYNKELSLFIWKLISLSDGKIFLEMFSFKLGPMESESLSITLAKFFLVRLESLIK
jgi:hypothetical protein